MLTKGRLFTPLPVLHRLSVAFIYSQLLLSLHHHHQRRLFQHCQGAQLLQAAAPRRSTRRVPLGPTHWSTGAALLGECFGQQQWDIQFCTACISTQQVPAALGTLSTPAKEASCCGRYFLPRSTRPVLNSSIAPAMENNLLGRYCLHKDQRG